MIDQPFNPYWPLRNAHLMTIVPTLWFRSTPLEVEGKARLFRVAEDSQVLGYHHVLDNDRTRPTLLIVHGLEGSSESSYIIGMAAKAMHAGLNVVRLNIRNCGGTLELTPTLYNAGLSADMVAVAKELKEQDGVKSIFFAGYSLGGNIILKAAAELSSVGPTLLAGVCAISPSLDLPVCVAALEHGFNRIYEYRFLRGLKAKVVAKNALFPNRYDVSLLPRINRIRQFDDAYTSRDAGYSSAEEYYEKTSSLPIIPQSRVPILIITAQDDPICPYKSFQSDKLHTPFVTVLAPKHGGHAGFLGGMFEDSGKVRDRFWAENRVVEFCTKLALHPA